VAQGALASHLRGKRSEIPLRLALLQSFSEVFMGEVGVPLSIFGGIVNLASFE
jgi:hypothetical protein